jgi:hypothetical protein
MENKEIDAVGMVRKIRDSLYQETKDLSTQELIAFYRHHAAAAKERLSRLQEEREEAVGRRA